MYEGRQSESDRPTRYRQAHQVLADPTVMSPNLLQQEAAADAGDGGDDGAEQQRADRRQPHTLLHSSAAGCASASCAARLHITARWDGNVAR